MDKKINVLVVDDESDFRQLMTFWLKLKGYDVTIACDGESAIKIVKEGTTDIIFLDLNMPRMHGTETLKKIREFNKDIPVIIISAYVSDPKAGEAMSYGVSGMFYKGKDFEEGLSLLESALKTHKKLKTKPSS